MYNIQFLRRRQCKECVDAQALLPLQLVYMCALLTLQLVYMCALFVVLSITDAARQGAGSGRQVGVQVDAHQEHGRQENAAARQSQDVRVQRHLPCVSQLYSAN